MTQAGKRGEAIRVANRLRIVLDDRQISHADLSYLTGIPYSAVRKMSKARSCPSLAYALIVSQVLGMSVEELFWLEDKPTTREGFGADDAAFRDE